MPKKSRAKGFGSSSGPEFELEISQPFSPRGVKIPLVQQAIAQCPVKIQSIVSLVLKVGEDQQHGIALLAQNHSQLVMFAKEEALQSSNTRFLGVSYRKILKTTIRQLKKRLAISD